jgi:SHS2 domain-containing protein
MVFTLCMPRICKYQVHFLLNEHYVMDQVKVVVRQIIISVSVSTDCNRTGTVYRISDKSPRTHVKASTISMLKIIDDVPS